MTTVGLFVKLEAKKGKESELEQFLRNGLSIVENEHDTVSWYAIRLGPTTYAIFDTFADNDGRQAHLAGQVAKQLMERSSELLSKPPAIEKVDILAAKLGQGVSH